LREISFESIRVVSWDLDGTLYSLPRLKRRIWWNLLKSVVAGHGLTAYRELGLLRDFRDSVNEIRLFGGDLSRHRPETLKADRLSLLKLERVWYGKALREIGPQDGVVALLEHFRARSLLQTINSDFRADFKLKALRLADLFDFVVSGEDLGFVKPSPKGFETIAQRFAVPLSSILHIGDSLQKDGASASAAGCRCLILGHDFRDFPSLLARISQQVV
jgi:FMN phosphatase YigB (HAD superfamily)